MDFVRYFMRMEHGVRLELCPTASLNLQFLLTLSWLVGWLVGWLVSQSVS